MAVVFKITKNFHIIHMTDDLAALDTWYDEVFGVARFMHKQYSDVLKRDASLVLIGDLCIEPMAPSFRIEGWDSVAIGRFWNRFGKRWHSIAWYVDQREHIKELFDELIANEVRMYSGAGQKAPTEPPPGALFTHPRDTITQLEFMPHFPGMGDPRFHGSFDPGWWTRDHPLHVQKSAYTTLTVRDLDAAKRVYIEVLRGTLLHEEERALTGTRSAFILVGDDLVIELAQPLDTGSAMGRDLEENSQTLYSVSLKVRDLGEAERHLTSHNIAFTDRDDNTLYTDPATTHGVIFGFTTWEIPNDPRKAWA